MRASLLLCATLCLAGCATTAPVAPPAVHPQVFAAPGQFGTRPEIPAPDEVHALTPAQRAAVLGYLDAHEHSGVPRNRLLYDYMEQVTQDFNYQGDTLMAGDALALRRGNCLSLAILTTAVAKLAGVDIGYQLVDDIPVYQLSGQLMKRGVHVRSILYETAREPHEGVIVFSRPGIVIDYFPTGGSRFLGNLRENGYLAMYYRNIAAEALEREDYRTAFWYVLESLAPYLHEGYLGLARAWYEAGELERAEGALKDALENAFRRSTRSLYQAKLQALNEEMHKGDSGG